LDFLSLIDRLSIYINEPTKSIRDLDKCKNCKTDRTLADVTHMLLVLDSDDKPNDAFEKLKSNFRLLKEKEIQVEEPQKLGVWQAPNDIKKDISFHSACYLLPGTDKDGQLRKGCLEDLLLDSLEPKQLACIEAFGICHSAAIPTEKQFQFGVKNKVQAWL